MELSLTHIENWLLRASRFFVRGDFPTLSSEVHLRDIEVISHAVIFDGITRVIMSVKCT